MKYGIGLLGLLFLMGISALGPSSGSAYEVGHLRLTGKLFPMEAGKNGNRPGAIEAIIDGTQWVFEVAGAKNLNGGGPSGKSILRQLFPGRIIIHADDESLERWRRDNGAANEITIVGFLYPASGVFVVTSVAESRTTGRADFSLVERNS